LEEIIDRLLLIYLIDNTSSCGTIDGDTKLQKLVFLSELEMIDSRLKGLNYHFYKFIHGPYSKQLHDDLGVLEEWGLYLPDEYMLTSNGQAVIGSLEEIWSRNSSITSKIDNTLNEYAHLPLRSILSIVYNLDHPFYRSPRKIADLKNFTPILYKMTDGNAETTFTLSESDIETLEILIDQENYSHLICPDEDDEHSIPYPRG
jgi:hypothetical protein